MKNLNTILPFYDAITEQYRYREDCDVQPCLAVTDTMMIPWVIRRAHNTSVTIASISIQLYTLANVTSGSPITGTTAGLTITSGTSYDHIIHTMVAMTAIPTGSYYMVVTDSNPTTPKLWYSETFTVVSSVATLLKFQFSNTTELDSIPANFVQIAYFNTTLKTPEYLREDTGDKRDGLLVKEKQVKMKSYTMRQILAPEYLVDALMNVPMMDSVVVTVQSGEVLTFNEARIKDPEWLSDTLGSRAKVEIQLIKDVVVKKLNFKETGYEGGSDMSATIKQGVGLTVTDGGGLFYYTVTFTEAMSAANYTPSAYCVQHASPYDVQIPQFSNITINGFNIYTTVACDVKWTAILV